MKMKQDCTEDKGTSICRVENCDSKIVYLNKECKIKVCVKFKQLFFSNEAFEWKENNQAFLPYIENIQRVLKEMRHHGEEYSIDDIFSKYISDIEKNIAFEFRFITEKYAHYKYKIKDKMPIIQQKLDELQSKYHVKLFAYQNSIDTAGDDSLIYSNFHQNKPLLPEIQNLCIGESKEENASVHEESKASWCISKEEHKEINVIPNIESKHDSTVIINNYQDIIDGCRLQLDQQDECSIKQINTRNEVDEKVNQDICNKETANINQEILINENEEKLLKDCLSQYFFKIKNWIKLFLFLIAIMLIITVVIYDKVASISKIRELEQKLKMFTTYKSFIKYNHKENQTKRDSDEKYELTVNLALNDDKALLDLFLHSRIEKFEEVSIRNAEENDTNIVRLLKTTEATKKFSFENKGLLYTSISFYTESLITFLKGVSEIVFFDNFILREEDLENIIKGSSNSEVIKMWHSIYIIDRQLDFSGPQYKTKKLVFFNLNRCYEIFGERLKMWMVIKAIAESSLKVSLESFEYTSCVLSEIEVKDQFRINGIENIKVIKL